MQKYDSYIQFYKSYTVIFVRKVTIYSRLFNILKNEIYFNSVSFLSSFNQCDIVLIYRGYYANTYMY